MKAYQSTSDKVELRDDFLNRSSAFRNANRHNPLVWFTPLATGNKPACDRASSSLRPILGLIKYCLFHLPFRVVIPEKGYDLAISSVFVRDEKGGASDRFFGTLPQQLADDGVACAMVGKIAWTYDKKIEAIAAKQSDVPFYCPTHLLTKYEGMFCVLQAVTTRFSMAGIPRLQAARCQKECGLSCLHDIIIGLFYKRMLEKIKVKNKDVRILYAFEGNTWESACAMVDPHSIGYQHGALLPNQTKIRKDDARPLPSKIISSGPAATNALITIGGYPPDQIESGYALRLGGIYNVRPKKAYPSKFEKFLYFLQGGEEKNGIVDFLTTLRQAGFEITLRPHPAHPVGDVFAGFELSKEDNVYQDILRHDACLYAGSTAAFEAIALGVPVFNIRTEEDPLFQCPAMHYTMTAPEMFDAILREVESNGDFARDFVVARAYFENYFRAPDQQTKDNFKQWLSLSSVS